MHVAQCRLSPLVIVSGVRYIICKIALLRKGNIIKEMCGKYI